MGESATPPIELRYGTPAALLVLAGKSPQRRRALLAHRIAAHSGASNCGIQDHPPARRRSEVDFEDVKTVIATGLSQRRPQVAPLTVVQHSTGLRTGTVNQPILNNVLNTPQQGQPGTRPGNRPTTAA